MHRSLPAALALALTTFGLPALAQDAAPTKEAPAATQPFLWVIEGRDAPTFLYGTMHVPDDRVLAVPEVVDEAIERCDAFYAELALDPASQMAMSTKMMLPGAKTLRDIVPAEVLDRAGAFVKKKLGAGIAPFLKFKLWAFTQLLTQLDFLPAMQMGKKALDAALYGRAQQAGKEVGGLETPAEQLAVFDSLTEEQQVEQLRQTLDKLEKAAAEGTSPHEALIKVWLSGDLEALQAHAAEEMGQDETMSEEFTKLLLTDRNVRMADRIAKRLEDEPGKSYFFAVGALHWPGEEGMLALLRAKGFTIRRLETSDAGSFKKP